MKYFLVLSVTGRILDTITQTTQPAFNHSRGCNSPKLQHPPRMLMKGTSSSKYMYPQPMQFLPPENNNSHCPNMCTMYLSFIPFTTSSFWSLTAHKQEEEVLGRSYHTNDVNVYLGFNSQRRGGVPNSFYCISCMCSLRPEQQVKTGAWDQRPQTKATCIIAEQH